MGGWEVSQVELVRGTLRETKSLHLKMNFLLGWPIFRGYVSFRECTSWCKKGGFLRCSQPFEAAFRLCLRQPQLSKQSSCQSDSNI